MNINQSMTNTLMYSLWIGILESGCGTKNKLYYDESEYGFKVG